MALQRQSCSGRPPSPRNDRRSPQGSDTAPPYYRGVGRTNRPHSGNGATMRRRNQRRRALEAGRLRQRIWFSMILAHRGACEYACMWVAGTKWVSFQHMWDTCPRGSWLAWVLWHDARPSVCEILKRIAFDAMRKYPIPFLDVYHNASLTLSNVEHQHPKAIPEILRAIRTAFPRRPRPWI
jgi:hypothetical protein